MLSHVLFFKDKGENASCCFHGNSKEVKSSLESENDSTVEVKDGRQGGVAVLQSAHSDRRR